jgi:hypothetical protein
MWRERLNTLVDKLIKMPCGNRCLCVATYCDVPPLIKDGYS